MRDKRHLNHGCSLDLAIQEVQEEERPISELGGSHECKDSFISPVLTHRQ